MDSIIECMEDMDRQIILKLIAISPTISVDAFLAYKILGLNTVEEGQALILSLHESLVLVPKDNALPAKYKIVPMVRDLVIRSSSPLAETVVLDVRKR